METRSFPTASFALTEPIELGPVPTDGAIYAVDALGDLTLHGITETITISLEAQVVGSRVVVVGSTEVSFGDYGIALPSAPILVGVDGVGQMELQLTFVPG